MSTHVTNSNIKFDITPEQADQLREYYNTDATEDYEVCELLDKLIDDYTSWYITINIKV